MRRTTKIAGTLIEWSTHAATHSPSAMRDGGGMGVAEAANFHYAQFGAKLRCRQSNLSRWQVQRNPKLGPHQLSGFSFRLSLLSLLVFSLPCTASQILLVNCLTDSCTDHCTVVSKQQLRFETIKQKTRKSFAFWVSLSI